MKKNIHPQTQTVIFKDVATNTSFLGTTTMTSKHTMAWTDGKTYPLITLDVSSASHPFYTGKGRDSGGEDRAAKFKKKYEGFKKQA